MMALLLTKVSFFSFGANSSDEASSVVMSRFSISVPVIVRCPLQEAELCSGNVYSSSTMV